MQGKILYRFAEELAARTQTMLLATTTPVQLHPMELWDLLYILSVNNPQVLGNENSLWRRYNAPETFDLVAGRLERTQLYEKWQYWRNPLPARLDTRTEVFDWVRQDLGLTVTDDFATNADLDRLDPSRSFDLEFMTLREVNPFTQWVVKRSRDRLEDEGKLVNRDGYIWGWPTDSLLSQHGASLRSSGRLCKSASPAGEGWRFHKNPFTTTSGKLSGGGFKDIKKNAGWTTAGH